MAWFGSSVDCIPDLGTSQVLEHDAKRYTIDPRDENTHDCTHDGETTGTVIRRHGDPVENPEDHETNNEDEEQPSQSFQYAASPRLEFEEVDSRSKAQHGNADLNDGEQREDLEDEGHVRLILRYFANHDGTEQGHGCRQAHETTYDDPCPPDYGYARWSFLLIHILSPAECRQHRGFVVEAKPQRKSHRCAWPC